MIWGSTSPPVLTEFKYCCAFGSWRRFASTLHISFIAPAPRSKATSRFSASLRLPSAAIRLNISSHNSSTVRSAALLFCVSAVTEGAALWAAVVLTALVSFSHIVDQQASISSEVAYFVGVSLVGVCCAVSPAACADGCTGVRLSECCLFAALSSMSPISLASLLGAGVLVLDSTFCSTAAGVPALTNTTFSVLSSNEGFPSWDSLHPRLAVRRVWRLADIFVKLWLTNCFSFT